MKALFSLLRSYHAGNIDLRRKGAALPRLNHKNGFNLERTDAGVVDVAVSLLKSSTTNDGR